MHAGNYLKENSKIMRLINTIFVLNALMNIGKRGDEMTLQECLENAQRYNGNIEDAEIMAIRNYAIQDDKYPEVVKLLQDIMTWKAKQLTEDLNKIRAYMISPCDFYYRTNSHKNASTLDYLTRKMMLGYGFDEKDKEFMANYILPDSGPFWHDLAEVIKSVQDDSYKPQLFNIYPAIFKGDENNGKSL